MCICCCCCLTILVNMHCFFIYIFFYSASFSFCLPREPLIATLFNFPPFRMFILPYKYVDWCTLFSFFEFLPVLQQTGTSERDLVYRNNKTDIDKAPFLSRAHSALQTCTTPTTHNAQATIASNHVQPAHLTHTHTHTYPVNQYNIPTPEISKVRALVHRKR